MQLSFLVVDGQHLRCVLDSADDLNVLALKLPFQRLGVVESDRDGEQRIEIDAVCGGDRLG